MKKKTIVITSISFLVIAILAILVMFGGLSRLSGIQFNDGFTLIGSTLQLTNLTSIYPPSNENVGASCSNSGWGDSFSNTPIGTVIVGKNSYQDSPHKLITSKYWTFPAGRDDTGASLMTDEKVNSGSCVIYNTKLEDKKIRINIDYTLSGATTNGASFIKLGVLPANSNICFPSSINLINGGGMGTQIFYQEGQGSFSTLFETIPNIFNNKTDVYVNGVLQASYDRSQAHYLTFCAYQASYVNNNLRYQPLLSCQKAPSDMFAQQSFSAGTQISLDSFRFPIKQLCGSRPTEFITGNNSEYSIDDSLILYDQLIHGQTVTVPADSTWTIPYIFDNSKGLVNVICPDNAPLNENNICTQQTGLATTISQGTIDTASNTYVIQPQTVCEGLVGVKAIWNPVDQTCSVPSPVIEYCSNPDGCTLRVSDVCANSKLQYNPDTKTCIANVQVNLTSGTVQSPQSNTGKYLFYGMIGLIIILIISLIIVATRKKRR